MPKKINKSARKKVISVMSLAKSRPPPLNTNVVFRHTYRYLNNSVNQTSINGLNLLRAPGMIAATVNTLYGIAGSVKVNKITIFPAITLTGTQNTPALINWSGATYSPNLEKSVSQPFGDTEPYCLVARPPRNSLAANWQLSASTSFVNITCPAGSIIDFDLSVVLYDDDVSNVATTVGGTATISNMYYQPIDINGQFKPVGLSNL